MMTFTATVANRFFFYTLAIVAGDAARAEFLAEMFVKSDGDRFGEIEYGMRDEADGHTRSDYEYSLRRVELVDEDADGSESCTLCASGGNA